MKEKYLLFFSWLHMILVEQIEMGAPSRSKILLRKDTNRHGTETSGGGCRRRNVSIRRQAQHILHWWVYHVHSIERDKLLSKQKTEREYVGSYADIYERTMLTRRRPTNELQGQLSFTTASVAYISQWYRGKKQLRVSAFPLISSDLIRVSQWGRGRRSRESTALDLFL